MFHYVLKLNLVLAVSLALFYTSVQLQGFTMYSDEEMQRQAHFIKHPFSVLSAPLNILSSFVSMTSLDCVLKCLQTTSCVSFNFGIRSKLCQLLATDKYNSSEMFESSEEFDHHSIMTPCLHQPCHLVGRCQPIYASNDFLCVSSVIRYYMEEPLKNCNYICESHHLQCVRNGGFPTGDAVDLFKGVGIDCKKSSRYWATDQPCYSQNEQKCYGAKNIPSEINCEDARNPYVRRLCPCQ